MATGPGFLSFAINGMATQAAIQKISAAGFIKGSIIINDQIPHLWDCSHTH
jgi:hypothetical protein